MQYCFRLHAWNSSAVREGKLKVRSFRHCLGLTPWFRRFCRSYDQEQTNRTRSDRLKWPMKLSPAGQILRFGGQNTVLGRQDLFFFICLKQIFVGTKIFWGHCPRMPPRDYGSGLLPISSRRGFIDHRTVATGTRVRGHELFNRIKQVHDATIATAMETKNLYHCSRRGEL